VTLAPWQAWCAVCRALMSVTVEPGALSGTDKLMRVTVRCRKHAASEDVSGSLVMAEGVPQRRALEDILWRLATRVFLQHEEEP
jgi:hypothetical protein